MRSGGKKVRKKNCHWGGNDPKKHAHLDKLAGLDALLEGTPQKVSGEDEARVGGCDVLLDRKWGGATPVFEGLDGLDSHLRDNHAEKTISNPGYARELDHNTTGKRGGK